MTLEAQFQAALIPAGTEILASTDLVPAEFARQLMREIGETRVEKQLTEREIASLRAKVSEGKQVIHDAKDVMLECASKGGWCQYAQPVLDRIAIYLRP